MDIGCTDTDSPLCYFNMLFIVTTALQDIVIYDNDGRCSAADYSHWAFAFPRHLGERSCAYFHWTSSCSCHESASEDEPRSKPEHQRLSPERQDLPYLGNPPPFRPLIAPAPSRDYSTTLKLFTFLLDRIWMRPASHDLLGECVSK